MEVFFARGPLLWRPFIAPEGSPQANGLPNPFEGNVPKGLSARIRHPEVPPTLRKEDSKPQTTQEEIRRCAAQGSCLICVLIQVPGTEWLLWAWF